MTLDNLIQLSGVVVTLIVAVVSFWQSREAIRLSQRSIELTQKSMFETARPYVYLYVDSVTFHRFAKTLTIKNFGATPAVISSLEFLTKLDDLNEQFKLKSLIGTTLMPNQSFSTILDNDFTDPIQYRLSYLDMNGGEYDEEHILHSAPSRTMFWLKHKSNMDTEEIHTLKEAVLALLSYFRQR